MRNKITFTIVFIMFTLFFYSPVLADTAVHLDIKTNASSIYNQDITVAPCDGDDDIDTPDTITAYCALVQSGIISDWSGLWVNSINGILNNDSDNGIYWMWLANLNTDNTSPSSSYNLSAKQYVLTSNDRILFYYNTNPLSISVDNDKPEVGQSIKVTITELGLDSNWNPIWNNATGGKVAINSNTYDLDGNGTYSFEIKNTEVLSIKGQKTGFIDSKELTITPVAAKVVSGGGWWPNEISSPAPAPLVSAPATTAPAPVVTAPVVEKIKFDLNKAFEFLTAQQKEDGSFGEDLYTDWTTIALAGENYQKQVLKLVKYLGGSKVTGTFLTDYERRAMALMALGLNPYNTNGENYIEKIVSGFDGKQFGDINEDNDDIFALIVLSNAGYTQEEKMISDDIDFILNRQKENGSWGGSIDMTGAAIESLSVFSPKLNLGESLKKAKEFLKQNQKEDGGFGNVSSTAWAIGGILALQEKPEDWIKNDNTPLDYLATMQDTDGGIKNEYLQNKIWETAYATTALSGKTWNQIMQKFEKPEGPKGQSLKNSPRTVLKKKTPANQNTSTIINTITETPIDINTKPQNRGWFMWLLGNIFGF